MKKVPHRLNFFLKKLYTSEGESVEWLNYMMEKIWRSVDPEVFTVVEDLLEDTLQSIAPSFIVSINLKKVNLIYTNIFACIYIESRKGIRFRHWCAGTSYSNVCTITSPTLLKKNRGRKILSYSRHLR
jgi:hypothetical protein